MDKYDVIIVGGGVTGLSAALALGRSRRRVLVIDKGEQRNLPAAAIHGFLTRDGTPPAEFLRLAREDLKPYDSVRLISGEVTDASCTDLFRVLTSSGAVYHARKLILATGIRDRLPELPGVEVFWGKTVSHCPYCHGWEMRDQRLVAFSRGEESYELALELLLWSRQVVFCTDGYGGLDQEKRERLARHGIRLVEEKVERLEGEGDRLRHVLLQNGERIPCDALFLTPDQCQTCNLPQILGCEMEESGMVKDVAFEKTCVPGLYVAGNASRGVQLVIVAAAEGTKAAFAINEELVAEDTR